MSLSLVVPLILALVQLVFGDNCTLSPLWPGTSNESQYTTFTLGLFWNVAFELLAQYETPIVVRSVMAVGELQWECYAAYHEEALGLRSRERPFLSDNIPDELQISDDMRLACYAYTTPFYFKQLFDISLEANNNLNTLFLSLGLKSMTQINSMSDEIDACNDDESCIDGIASSYGYCPDIIGIITGKRITATWSNDGFNQNGNQTPFGECTANCRPFSDPIGFFDPRVKNIDIDINMNKNPNNEWYELLEDNDKGFFNRQQHITPHIGYTVDPITFSKDRYDDLAKRISDPKYDYVQESELLLGRLQDTATNNTKKAIIEVMDDKLFVAAMIQTSHRYFFQPSYTQFVLMEVGNRIAEFQATLISWREKIKYNRIRPTTIIQSGKYTEEFITTYGGKFSGVSRIRTQDFEPYIRTMPHSEYPSGSGCICKMVADFTETVLQKQYGVPSMPVAFFFLPITNPISKYEPYDENPNPPPYIEQTRFVMSNVQKLYENCKQSRLWGGMHFTQSIQASDALCAGFGDEIYNYLQALLNGQVPQLIGAEDGDRRRILEKRGERLLDPTLNKK